MDFRITDREHMSFDELKAGQKFRFVGNSVVCMRIRSDKIPWVDLDDGTIACSCEEEYKGRTVELVKPDVVKRRLFEQLDAGQVFKFAGSGATCMRTDSSAVPWICLEHGSIAGCEAAYYDRSDVELFMPRTVEICPKNK